MVEQLPQRGARQALVVDPRRDGRLEVEVEPEAEDAEERLRDAVDEVAPALVHAAIVCEDRSMKQSKLDPVQAGDVEGSLSG